MRARRFRNPAPGAPRPGAQRGESAQDIHATALNMLARRALFERELAERLGRKGFSPAEVAHELRRLGNVGLLDDGTLARAVCKTELRRGRGPRAVLAVLRRRRVGGSLAEAAVASVERDDEEEALSVALAAAMRRYPQWRRVGQERRKMLRYLLVRGFAASAVREAVTAVERGERDAGHLEQGDPPDFL